MFLVLVLLRNSYKLIINKYERRALTLFIMPKRMRKAEVNAELSSLFNRIMNTSNKTSFDHLMLIILERRVDTIDDILSSINNHVANSSRLSLSYYLLQNTQCKLDISRFTTAAIRQYLDNNGLSRIDVKQVLRYSFNGPIHIDLAKF